MQNLINVGLVLFVMYVIIGFLFGLVTMAKLEVMENNPIPWCRDKKKSREHRWAAFLVALAWLWVFILSCCDDD